MHKNQTRNEEEESGLVCSRRIIQLEPSMKVYFLIVYYIHAVQNIALEHRGKSQMFLNLILLGML